MPRDGEVNRTMPDLIELLRSSYSDEDQVGAKQMQKGYSVLRDRLHTQGRLVVTVHGHPEAVMLGYQDFKMLSKLVTALMEKAENDTLAALAEERLGSQGGELLPLEEGLQRIRDAMVGPSDQ